MLLKPVNFIGVFLLFCNFTFAQTPILENSNSGNLNGQYDPCGFDLKHQQLLQNNPLYMQKTIEFNEFMETFVPTKVSSTPYRVPVVVHVMETGNALTEITDAQIREGIKQLNERYRKVPGSLGDGNGVDVQLEFALAVRDPSGNCTNGIVRVDMTGNATYMSSGVYSQSAGISDASLKATSVWDQTQYYNIWLVSEIDNNNGGAGTQGYAYFASSHGTSVDGAVILCNNWKDPSSTTGAHELGHAFNLYHTFEGDGTGSTCPTNTNCNTQGDRVCDTPPHMRSSSDCVIGTNPCDGGSSTELFIHNYMDYSSDACQNEFTAGQRTRVQAAMTTIRTSFLESNGNMSLVPPTSAGIAFEASNNYVCSGSSIQFYDISSCTPNTFLDSTYWTGITFSWTFDNGASTYTSNLQNPLMSLPNGEYDVTLQITNSFGTTSLTEYSYVVVGGSPVAACTPTTNNEGNYWNTVNHVTFNTIDNSTSQYVNVAYTDFTCTANTVVTEGTTHTLSVDLRAGSSGQEVVEVYIDYNNNGTFEAGELVLSGNSGGTSTTATVSGNVTIPTNAVEGTLLRMRVFGETGTLTSNERNCLASSFIGDCEDYGVYIMTACVNPVISVSATSDPTSCSTANGSITISGTGTGDITWSGTSSGSNAGVSLPYTITGLASGTYDIEYGTAGCMSNLVSATLNSPDAPAAPTVTVDGPTTFCDGGSVVLTSSYATGNTWSSGETTQSITVTTSGSYYVSYDDGLGCTSTSTSTLVTVNPSPSAPLITTSGNTTICAGQTVDLTSSVGSGNVWSTGETTQTITVGNAGDYTVHYVDGNGCSSAESAITTVTISTSFALPLVEGFTAVTFVPTDWTMVNTGGPANWIRSGTVGNAPTAGNSMQFNNFSTDNTGFNDEIWVKPLDFSSATGVTMTFDVAYARFDATYSDGLEVLVSTDCGNNFTSVYLKTGTTLATDPDQASAYAPGTWRNETIDLSGYDGESSVTVAFRNIAGYGNNIYVDNINIDGTVSCSDPDVPTVSGSTAICDGASTTLTIATGNLNDATDWQWYEGSCGGTSVGSGTSITVTPGTTTSYFVRGEGGCVTPGACLQIDVTVSPFPSTPIVTVVDGCGSSTLSTSGSNLLWSTTETTASISVSTAGTYTVTQTVGGCESLPGTGIANPSPSPTISLGTVTDPSTCGGTDGTIVVNGTGSGVVSWTGSASGSSGNVSLPYTITGLSQGSYDITFDDGCPSNILSTTLTDPAAPSAPSVSVVDDCGFSVLSAVGSNLLWSTGETTSSITVNIAGTYTVNQTVNGCVSADASITASPLSAPSSITSINPTNGGTGVTVPTTFDWTTAPESGVTYNIVIATDAGLTSIVDQATGLATNTYVSSSLSAATTYYWQVTATNTCGNSTTTVFSFTTTSCTLYASADVPVNIPTGQATYSSTITIPTGGTINDVNVIDLIGNHGALGNLIFTLQSPLGTQVVLMNQLCGNQNDFDIDFDDEAASAVIPCPATDGNAYQPNGLLSDFDGEDAAGTWTLFIQDVSNPNSGALTGWSLEICTDPVVVCTEPDVPTISSSAGPFCDGDLATLTISGNLNDATDWIVYSGSCGGTMLGSTNTSTIDVLLVGGTNDFFIRGEGGCATAASCGTISIDAGNSTTGSETVSACDTYTWATDGNTYTSSGTYTAVLTNAAGCDSVVTLNLTINTATSGSETVSACDTYTWPADGNTYTSSGTYTALLTNAAGCDSIATLNLTISTFAAGTDVLTACDSYMWIDGITYTSSNNTATYTIVGGAANGCDSVVTLDLTINYSTSGSESATACDMYVWSADGNTYTSSGVYTAVLTNAAVCDSVVTLTLTINNSTTGTETVSACDTYTWATDGNTYTSSGTYTAVLTNAAGCDSVVTLNLTINTATSGSESITTCGSYTWPADGNTYTSSGTYTALLTNAAGCDSIATLNLTISTFAAGTDVLTACDSFMWIDGITYTTSNNTATYTIVGGAANGCDSVVTLDLTINYSTSGSESATACDMYVWSADGNTYTSSGVYTAVLTNAAGCDSVVTLNLTINNSTTGTETVSACDTYTWATDGNTYTSSGTYTALLTNAAGCDSIVTLDLTINTTTSGSESVTTCGSYTWSADGNTYASSGTYTALLTNAAGCDSIATLNLTISTFAAGTDVLTACDSYMWIDGITYTTSNNTATFTIVGGAANGCDSIVTLDLTINNSTSGSESATACDMYIWPTDGNTYTSSGVYTAVLTNAAGCDSVVTLTLTINNSTTGTETVSACDIYTWATDGNTYTSSGTYTAVLTNAAGCDSVVTLDLTINTATSGSESVTTCGSYTWTADGNTYTSSGTYTALLTNAAGCDSIATLNLTISTFAAGTDVLTACDSYMWIDGITYTSSNNTATFTIVGGAANGCDSIVTLDLTINNSTSGSESATACDMYLWPTDGNTYTSSGVYTAVLTNAAGCDSVVTLTLTINNLTTGTETVSACDTYTWATDGNTYTSSGTYTAVLTNAAGCDSVVTLDLTINTATSGSESVDACGSYLWTADGNIYTSSGTYTAVLTNTVGCDSIATLNLTINAASSGVDVISACDSYTWIDGITYTSSNNTAMFVIAGGASNGCDSIVTLDLTINYSTSSSETVTACDMYVWPTDGNTYTSSGVYTAVLTNAAGCDSIVTLDLTVNNSSSGSESIIACDSYTWAADGNTYTTSGSYTALLTNVNGCDSIATLDLTIGTSTITEDTVSACVSYIWSADGNTYTTSGTYNAVTTNIYGCDSSITLYLTINQNPSVVFNGPDTLCLDAPLFDLTGYASPTGGTFTGTGVVGNNFDVNVSDTGTFMLNYVYTDPNGCSSSDIAFVTVDDCLGVDELSKLVFGLYPNPNTGQFTIYSNQLIERVDVIDNAGRLVKSILPNEFQLEVQLNGVAKGTYLIRVYSEDQMQTDQIIIQN